MDTGLQVGSLLLEELSNVLMRIALAIQVLMQVSMVQEIFHAHKTYKSPRTKTITNDIFLDFSMFSCRMIGTGIKKTTKSLVTCHDAWLYQYAPLLIQCPCCRLFQLYEMGIH